MTLNNRSNLPRESLPWAKDVERALRDRETDSRVLRSSVVANNQAIASQILTNQAHETKLQENTAAVSAATTQLEELNAPDGPLSELNNITEVVIPDFNQQLGQISQDVIEAKDNAVAAAVLYIDSSRGMVFKNSAVGTVLTVTIFYAGEPITNLVDLHARLGQGTYLEWSWRREEEEGFSIISSADPRISQGGFVLNVTPADVDEKTVFRCTLND